MNNKTKYLFGIGAILAVVAAIVFVALATVGTLTLFQVGGLAVLSAIPIGLPLLTVVIIGTAVALAVFAIAMKSVIFRKNNRNIQNKQVTIQRSNSGDTHFLQILK